MCLTTGATSCSGHLCLRPLGVKHTEVLCRGRFKPRTCCSCLRLVPDLAACLVAGAAGTTPTRRAPTVASSRSTRRPWWALSIVSCEWPLGCEGRRGEVEGRSIESTLLKANMDPIACRGKQLRVPSSQGPSLVECRWRKGLQVWWLIWMPSTVETMANHPTWRNDHGVQGSFSLSPGGIVTS